MATSDFFYYDDEPRTLAEVITQTSFARPFVAKTFSKDAEFIKVHSHCECGSLFNKKILFQRHFRGIFARIKILPFDNGELMERETQYGRESVLEHDNYVGKEFLLPITFRGKIMFPRRPGSRGRYSEITQVIEDNQDIFQIEDTTVATEPGNLNKSMIIKEKTILQIKGKSPDRQNPEISFIICTDGKTEFALREGSQVNGSAIEKTCCLRDLLYKSSYFPRVIRLVDKISPDDAVLKDCEINSAVEGILEGPLEVNGLEEKEFIIGSVRNKTLRTFETVLIPELLWNVISLRKRCFYSDLEEESYIENKFGKDYCQTYFVDWSVYLIPTEHCEITWLMSPSLRHRSNDTNPFQIIPIQFPESSDDEEDPYPYYVIPEVPPRIPERPPRSQEKEEPKSKSPNILKRITSLFRKDRRKSDPDLGCPPRRPPKSQLRRSVSQGGHLPPSEAGRPACNQFQNTHIRGRLPMDNKLFVSEEDTEKSYEDLTIDGIEASYEQDDKKINGDFYEDIANFESKLTQKTETVRHSVHPSVFILENKEKGCDCYDNIANFAVKTTVISEKTNEVAKHSLHSSLSLTEIKFKSSDKAIDVLEPTEPINKDINESAYYEDIDSNLMLKPQTTRQKTKISSESLELSKENKEAGNSYEDIWNVEGNNAMKLETPHTKNKDSLDSFEPVHENKHETDYDFIANIKDKLTGESELTYKITKTSLNPYLLCNGNENETGDYEAIETVSETTGGKTKDKLKCPLFVPENEDEDGAFDDIENLYDQIKVESEETHREAKESLEPSEPINENKDKINLHFTDIAALKDTKTIESEKTNEDAKTFSELSMSAKKNENKADEYYEYIANIENKQTLESETTDKEAIDSLVPFVSVAENKGKTCNCDETGNFERNIKIDSEETHENAKSKNNFELSMSKQDHQDGTDDVYEDTTSPEHKMAMKPQQRYRDAKDSLKDLSQLKNLRMKVVVMDI